MQSEFADDGTNSPIARIINNDLSVGSNITIAGTGAGRFDANIEILRSEAIG
jgi:hypothetical protein